MSSDWDFHAVEHSELEELVNLVAAFYREEGYPFDVTAARRALEQLIANENFGRVWWVRDHNGLPIAYVILAFGFSIEHRGRDAFIDELFVAQEHRHRGLGSRAIAHAERAAAEAGVQVLHLEVERAKTSTYDLYRRRGFKDHERYLLSKRLAPGPSDEER